MLRHLVRSLAPALVVLMLVASCGAAPAATPVISSAPAPAATAALPAPTTAPAAPTMAATPATSSSAAPLAPATPSGSAQLASSAPAVETVRLVLIPEQSEARYRVREQLASLQFPSDAIGATKSITGTIVGRSDGTIDSAQSKFVVDLRTLKSDQGMRDNFLRRNTLQSDTYPYATFVPTSAPGLPKAVPADGKASFQIVGDLTIRDVTKQVTWDATCQAQGDSGTCKASTSFPFEYIGLTPPKVPVVLSVVNNITLEIDFALQRVP